MVSLVLLLAYVPAAQAQQSDSPRVEATTDTSDANSTYTVQDDDTLYNISRRFGTSVRQLMRWNDLDSPDIKIGQTLQVRPPNRPDAPPMSSQKSTDPDVDTASSSTEEKRPERSTNRATSDRSGRNTSAARTSPARTASPRRVSGRRTPPGTVQAASNDTFVDLAIRYGTTADTLFALNDSLRAPLPPGRIVQLPDRYGPPSHVVKEGDTMYSIAGEYGVSVRALQDANDLENTSIQPGQKLRVPNRAPSSPDASRAPRPDTTGAVALYPAAFSGRLTASGTTYDPDSFVGSHPSLPYGSVVLLSHPGTRNHCFVEIIDRGPLEDDVLMDVSDAVARQLGVNPGARTNLELRVIWVER
jgi:LysM repeat protein